MQVKLTDWQDRVAHDPARFKIICAGRRAGKSVLARMSLLKWAVEKPGVYWLVNPTYRQAKAIHWRDILNEIPQKWVSKKNETELSIELNNGSLIELKGAENPDALRGVRLNGLIIDEIASIRNWDWLWQEVLRATLVDFEAPAIFISTPKGYNHFYRLFQKGQKDDPDYKSWRFTSYDNPKIPSSEVDKARSNTSNEFFAQEYLADFRKFTGLIYKGFAQDVAVVNPFDIPKEWEIHCGVDFGSNNPTAILWIAVDPEDNWFVVSEHYSMGKTIDYHAGVFNSHPLRMRVINIFGDPSGAQWIDEFRERSVYITPAVRTQGTTGQSWVLFGIEKVASKMLRVPGHTVQGVTHTQEQIRQGIPSLFIFKNCKNTLKELESYRWREKPATQAEDLNEPSRPEKANDHAMDALRYFAVSYAKQELYVPLKNELSERQWQIGR